MSTKNQNDRVDEADQICRSSLKKHWAEAQIDGPAELIVRYDDVAKQLITIGGFVLGVLATMLKGLGPATLSHLWLIIVGSSVLLFFLSAVAVCIFQPPTFTLSVLNAKNDEALIKCIEAWCLRINHVLWMKRLFLFLATGLFIVSFLTIMSLLLR